MWNKDTGVIISRIKQRFAQTDNIGFMNFLDKYRD